MSIINTPWVDGRNPEPEDIHFFEQTQESIYKFFIPWYASTVTLENEYFWPLWDRFGADWYYGYDEPREVLRLTTMLEF